MKMATINGVELEGFNLRMVSTHRNEMIDVPGSSENCITDMGYDGLILRLEGFETTIENYDAVIAEFMKSGAQTLIVREGWQYQVYSVQLAPSMLDGNPDTHFPYDLLLYTLTPYRESTALLSRSKEITSDGEEWIAEDMPSDNLLDNWRFDEWSDGISSAPDGWSKGGTILQAPSLIGDYSAKLTNVASTAAYISQMIDETIVDGGTYTFGMWVKCGTASRVRLIIYDNDGSGDIASASDYHIGSGNYEWMTVTRTFRTGLITASLRVHNYVGTGAVISIYCDGAVLVEGSSIKAPIQNILSDSSFEEWSSGVTSAPDDWTLYGSGATILRVAGTHGQYASQLTRNGTDCQMYQHNYNVYHQGKTLTASEWVKCSVAGRAFITIYDGFSTTNSSYHTGSGEWEWLTVTKTLNVAATHMSIYLKISNGDTSAQFDQAILIEADEMPSDRYDADIRSTGNVDSIPDIQIKGGVPSATYARTCGILNEDTNATIYSTGLESYQLIDTVIYSAKVGCAHKLTYLEAWIHSETAKTAYCKITYQAASLNSGVETDAVVFTTSSSSYVEKTNVPNIQAAIDETLTVKYYIKTSAVGYDAYSKDTITRTQEYRHDILESPEIYNVTDDTIKSLVANQVLEDMLVRINADGTGTLRYEDDFTSEKWQDAYYDMNGVSQDTTNDELDLGNNDYLAYKIETKWPITGIPVLTALIDRVASMMHISISDDAVTWHNIYTDTVDNVETDYELDSSGLSLKGLTSFYFKFICDSDDVAIIKNFDLCINKVTLDAEHPKIIGGASSKFKCDFGSGSSENCEVTLEFRERSWVG